MKHNLQIITKTLVCTVCIFSLWFTACRTTPAKEISTEEITAGETLSEATATNAISVPEAAGGETAGSGADGAESENLLYAADQQEKDSPEWVKNLAAAKDEKTRQLFVVAGMGMDQTTATVSMHERDDNGNWRQVLSTPGFVGEKGMCLDAAHEEGCKQTPIGIYHFNKAFGIADDPGCGIPYTKVTEDLYWSGDDRRGMHYNEMVDIKDYPKLDMRHSEHLIDYEYQYRYCLNISFNEEGIPGKGSAIFLHCFGAENPYSGGCVSVPEYIMKLVMQRVDEDCVVVIDTVENLKGTTANTVEMSQGAGGRNLSDDASDFVLLSEAVPDAILEIRYYSTYNFVGDRIDGYEEPVALLTREAATALQKVSEELLSQGYRLKIYDAYRPQMAVTHFVDWAMDPKDTRMKTYFYPNLNKDELFPKGYIAKYSGHSRGSTVDLTLFDMNTEKEADMGGTFDYFGELSHADYTGVTEQQYANRMLLREAMMRHGFKPISEEWWHFTLADEPYPNTYFTFPVSSKSVTK